ncbi:MAG: ketopantoate reductase family protein [Butyrivibrio sp.]
MKIEKVSIIGLGALGVMYAQFFTENMKDGQARVVASDDRIRRYKEEKIYSNGTECNFNYIADTVMGDTADLIILAVKNHQLKSALETMRNQVGKETVIISTLNGITSEEIIASEYGEEKVLLCTAQGMDAVKEENRLTYKNLGFLCIGTHDGKDSKELSKVTEFFDRINFPYKVVPDMKRQLWSKLMLNVGVNQAVAVFETTYSGVQKEGRARDVMIDAMHEVADVAAAKGINLTKEDVTKWLELVDTLNPDGMPSLRQDTLAKRKTEVELFGGTIIKAGEETGIPTPVNKWLYDKITEMEKSYL